MVSFTVVIIGFEREEYTVFESDQVVTLVVSVLEGSVRAAMTVALSTINGSALSESVIIVKVVQKYLLFSLSTLP